MTTASFDWNAPFASMDYAFQLLTSGPGQPVLSLQGLGVLGKDELTAEEVVPALRRSSQQVTDALWRLVLARVRAGEPAWTVVAATAMAPRMIAASRRYAQIPEHEIADVDAELLACLLEQFRHIDTTSGQIGRRLWQTVANAACRHAHRRRIDMGQTTAQVPKSVTYRSGRSPVTVLAEAVAQDVLTAEDADLVARTRLEHTSLKRVAHEMGLSYITARRRRVAAEEALARALAQADFAAR